MSVLRIGVISKKEFIMIKYRIVSKKPVVENMDQEEALACIAMFRENNPDTQYEIVEYNWSHVEKRMGRDPDLH